MIALIPQGIVPVEEWLVKNPKAVDLLDAARASTYEGAGGVITTAAEATISGSPSFLRSVMKVRGISHR